ncbi:potassium transporter Trk [Microbacterium sp. kSW2-24]|uniref:potassium transporter Trk n=1 Tax=Microbacterium galbinum TaxID=2851646 RepID=UPI001FFDA5F2|nr:potassium transporter Trk [Microbacterium galbinum]MCK2022964.1 potassium transporter Trk [Microbacterium galbinum]
MSSSETPQTVEATVRHVPRYGVFMGIGVVLGVIAAGILTFTGSFEESQALDVVYPPGQVFGFLLLWTVPIGIALGGVVALILERTGRRHDRVVRVDRETIIEIHDEAPGAQTAPGAQAAPEAAASDADAHAPERD